MAKFHINPQTGNPGRCKAAVQCPYGGESEHFKSKKDAREHYENKMERETFATTLPQTAVKTEEREKALEGFNSGEFDRVNMPYYDRNLVHSVLEGKTASAKDIDEMLERNWKLERDEPSGDADRTELVRQILDEVRKERQNMNTPSTLPTVANLDPENESVFASLHNRCDPKAGIASIETNLKLAREKQAEAQRYEKYKQNPSLSADEAAKYDSAIETSLIESQKANARAAAFKKEIQWMADNDPGYAASMDDSDRDSLELPIPDSGPNTPISASILSVDELSTEVNSSAVARELIETNTVTVHRSEHLETYRRIDGNEYHTWALTVEGKNGQMADVQVTTSGHSDTVLEKPDPQFLLERAVDTARSSEYYTSPEQLGYESGLSTGYPEHRKVANKEYKEIKDGASQFKLAIGEDVYSRVSKFDEKTDEF